VSSGRSGRRVGQRVGHKRRAPPQPLAERAAPGELPRGDLGPPARRPRGGVNAGRDTSDLPPGEEAGSSTPGKRRTCTARGAPHTVARRRVRGAAPPTASTRNYVYLNRNFIYYLCTPRARTVVQLNSPRERGIFEVDSLA
jgi:hypothetical protein